MKRSNGIQWPIVLCCIMLVGCGGGQPGGAPPARSQPKGATSAEARGGDQSGALVENDDKDIKTWSLADGSEFSGWVSGDRHAEERMWIWCDAASGSASYRIVANGSPGEWKEMRRSDVTDDDELFDDPAGNFGAVETLPAGAYTIEFKVGAEEFSGIAFMLK